MRRAGASNGPVVYANPAKAVFQAAAMGVLVLAFVAARWKLSGRKIRTSGKPGGTINQL